MSPGINNIGGRVGAGILSSDEGGKSPSATLLEDKLPPFDKGGIQCSGQNIFSPLAKRHLPLSTVMMDRYGRAEARNAFRDYVQKHHGEIEMGSYEWEALEAQWLRDNNLVRPLWVADYPAVLMQQGFGGRCLGHISRVPAILNAQSETTGDTGRPL